MTGTTLRDRVAAVADSISPTFGAEASVLKELLNKWDEVLPQVESSANDVQKAVPAAKSGKVEYVHINFDYLESFMKEVFIAAGVPENEAQIAADVLIYADKRGIDSHGIGRLNPIYIQRIRAGILKPTAPFTIVAETETTAVVDGNCGLGLYIGPRCMDMCIEKAKKHGLAMVVARNSTHYGAAGWYVNRAQENGCIGITGTNAR